MNFGTLKDENSPFTGTKQQYDISIITYIQPNFASQHSVNNVENKNYVYISEIKVVIDNLPWTLYFDGSKLKGAGAGFLLIDPKGIRICLVCILEFDCTNNIAEYEAIIQGLKKYLDLNIKVLVVYGDSNITVWQVPNSIHCILEHLQNYQKEVWKLILNFKLWI